MEIVNNCSTLKVDIEINLIYHTVPATEKDNGRNLKKTKKWKISEVTVTDKKPWSQIWRIECVYDEKWDLAHKKGKWGGTLVGRDENGQMDVWH